MSSNTAAITSSSSDTEDDYLASSANHRHRRPCESSIDTVIATEEISSSVSSAASASGATATTLGTTASTTDDDHTAYAEWDGGDADNWSAESVALSLISKFSDQQLPRACDLLWLVSEQVCFSLCLFRNQHTYIKCFIFGKKDAKQQLLPMPSSWTISPDDTVKIPFIRGTRDWAPPRPQIIFTRPATNE